MKRTKKLNSILLAAVVLLSACDQITTPEDVPPSAKAVTLTLTATKTYNPSASYADGTDLLDKDTIINLPASIKVTSGNAGNGNRVVLSFAGGSIENLVGVRCYYTSDGTNNSYAFSACDGGSGGSGVLPYYGSSDAVPILKGDTLILRVMSGDSSAPTTVSVSIAGIQNK